MDFSIDQVEIEELDKAAMQFAKKKWDSIAKPLDSLGKLEDLVCQIAGIQGSTMIDIHKRAVFVFCADNGIVEEGVTQTGQEVTAIVAKNMANGSASICRLAKKAECDVVPVNIGVKNPVEHPKMVQACVRKGTRNFLLEPAMTMEETMAAILTGAKLVQEYVQAGYQIFATGEMGIGNTTTSAAMTAALLGCDVDEVTGRGAGLSDRGLLKKKGVINQALEQYHLAEADPFTILQTVGGLDIAGMVGVYLGGALCHVPIIMDGVISAVAALCAERLFSGIKQYILPSHQSKEPASQKIMAELAKYPILDGNLALGEGSGAVMLFPLLDMAMEIYEENPTFGEISVDAYERY